MSRVGVKRRLDLPLTFSERLLNLFWMLMMLHQNNLKKGQNLFGFNLEYSALMCSARRRIMARLL